MSVDKSLDAFGIGSFKTRGHATESTILDLFKGGPAISFSIILAQVLRWNVVKGYLFCRKDTQQ